MQTFNLDTNNAAPISGKHEWIVQAKHEAYGVEGKRSYVGTERGARQVAAKIAKAAGYGWRGQISIA